MNVLKFGVWMVALTACGTEKVNQCSSDSDCGDIAYPFCDVNGEFSPSGGEKNVCTVTPPDCPINRCGCSPGATACDGGTLTTCNADGRSSTDTSCTLGCADSNDRCATFVPSNGLGGALLQASGESDVTFPNMSTIDTTACAVLDPAHGAITVTSIIVGSPEICVFIAKSFIINSVTVEGTRPLAFVSTGTIQIVGDVEVRAHGANSGPGASTQSGCVGGLGGTNVGGGGGNGTAGGSGIERGPGPDGTVTDTGLGGTAQLVFTPLVGGCAGGASGGGGGGAVQLVSLDTVVIDGLIDLAGGGSQTMYGGGGAGGTVIIESPHVKIGGGVVANGGAGAACGLPGPDGTLTNESAFGPVCVNSATNKSSGGNGGTIFAPASNGGGLGIVATNGGGGGGAVGRLRTVTLDGDYTKGADALISAVESKLMLVIR